MPTGTSDALRRANLSTVLTLLVRHGPSSRAVLARLSGRNRSTIGSLVADLAAMGLVREREPEPDGHVGRPSPVVSLRSDVAAVAVNPEIDLLRVTLVGLDGTFVDDRRLRFDHIPSVVEVVAATAELIADCRAACPDVRIVGVGGAVPGQVQARDGVVRNAPHLRWTDEPFGELLSEATRLPVRVANDASLGALAEHDFGAGRGFAHLLYVNGGASGIGGGAVVDGTLLGGAHGHAGELGHSRVSSSDLCDSAGLAGTLEAMVTRAELLDVLGLAGADADALHQALLADRSARVREVVERQLGHLAFGLAASVNMLNPEVIVLGGFLASLLAYDPGRLRVGVAEATLGPSVEGLAIVASQLGSRLLPMGAAHLAFAPLLREPTASG